MVLFADNLSLFDPASPPALSIRSLFYLVLAITGVIFVLVEGMLVYCIVCFRRQSATDTAEPPQIYGSQPIEVAWTLAPLLVVFVLFMVVIRTVIEIRQDEPPPGALQVTVVGHQWWWEFRYPDPEAGGAMIVTANEMHVPVDVPVYLELKSEDVVHSFWVPRLAGKTDVIPGKINRMWFRATEANTFNGWCAEFCGTQHANMMIRVVAEPRETFEHWLAQQKRPAATAGADEARKQFLALACVNCHAVRGTTARGTFGPDLTHLMSRPTIAARDQLVNDRQHLLDWVRDPQQRWVRDSQQRWVRDPRQPGPKPGCNMPSLHLSDAEIESVVDYLMTLK